jgi:hypothetical protein
MSYTIKKFNGQTLTVIKDGTLDTSSTSLQLPGRNYSGYGLSLNQSLAYLLENFANSIEPPNKVVGQLWYDSSVKKIKLFNGINFKSISHIESNTTPPPNQNIGDMWYNTTTNQLFVYDGQIHKLIGPTLTNPNAAQLLNRRLLDDGGNLRTVLQAVFDDTTIAIFSKDEFNISQAQTPITGFNKVYKGITLPSRIEFPNVQFGGIARSSETLLVGTQEVPSINFVQNTGASQTINTDIKIKIEPTLINDVFTNYRGLFLGAGDDFYLGYNNGNAYISNLTGPNLVFSVTANNTVARVATLDDARFSPNRDSATDIGSSTNKWKDVYANNFFAVDNPNLAPNNAAFRGRVIGTTVSATQGFTGNLVGNIRGDVLRDNGETVLSRSGVTANFFGQTNGNHVGNLLNLNAPQIDQIAVNVNGATTIFKGTLDGVAATSSTLRVDNNNRTGFVGGPQSSPTQLRNTVAVRDQDGNIVATQFVGLAQTTQAILDENAVPRLASKTAAPFTVVVREADGSINVGSIQGTASDSAKLTGLVPSVPAIPGTIPARDAGADIYANVFHGRATSANYADLAEKYLTDAEYEVGTVVMVGGEKEVTACTFGSRAIGAVSKNPAFMMNQGLENGTYIALKGRVPVKVVGSVKKGDKMIASENGVAIAGQFHTAADTFAIALESNQDTGVKLVECLIL